jgi:hypothetical protein
MSGKKHYHPAPPGWRHEPLKIGQRIYCGAWARSRGRRCRQAPVDGTTVCRMHGAGGGPKTDEGKARISAVVAASWARWRAERGLPEDWRYVQSRRRGGRQTAAQWLAANKPEEPSS